MKKILFILFSFIIASCVSNNNKVETLMGKSIMDKLSIQEMNECIKHDPFMKSVFEKIEEYNKSYSDADKAIFYPITYKRAYSYLKYIEDNKNVIKELYKQNKYSEAFDMQISKDTLCNAFFYAKASNTPPPVDNIENVVDTTAAL